MCAHRSSRFVGSAARLLGIAALLSFLAISGPAAAAGGPNITVNDPAPVTEVNNNTTHILFTISLDATAASDVTVTYATADNTAVAPGDYVAKSGTATITAGQTSTTVSVTVNDDALDEPNETFFLNLTGNPSANATIADPQGVGTIADNDSAPKISISDYSAAENVASGSGATFSVTLSAPSGQAVSVTYATSNGTATAGVDYTALPPTVLTFAAGETSKTITVPVVNDTFDENDETFNVNLTNAVNASFQDNKGVGTILNDDMPPTISITDISVIEGSSGTVNMPFTVSLSSASGKTVTVKYQTANSTATSPGDYTALGLTTLTFPPGTTALNVNVAVKGDTLDEDDESFTLNLSAATNALVADSQGVGTILDDDLAPTITIGDLTVAEPASGTASATFVVSLSTPSGKTVSANYATADGSATAGLDYQAQSGTVTLLPGQSSKQITVPINSDQLVEPNETFFVNLSNLNNVTSAKTQAVGTITSTGGVPTVSVGDTSAAEGNGVTALFTVGLSAPSQQSVTVNYIVAGQTAVAGSDFQVPATLSVTFQPNTTTQTIAVPILDDPLDENDETFTVTLTGATGATVGDGVATGTIVDNDPAPTLTISDVQVSDSGSTPNAIFTIQLSAPSGKPISLAYQTADGTATAGSDYVAQSGTVSIAVSATSATITVPIITDSQTEPNETFRVNLGNAVNATLAKSTGTGTISDQPQGAPQTILFLPFVRR